MPMINTSMPGMDDDENVNYKQMLLRQLQAQQEQPPEPANNNALVAGLNQSFSKLGTVGGKTADTSDVTRYANVLDQMKTARQQQDMAKTGQQEKILGMLAQLKDKDIQKQQELAIKEKEGDAKIAATKLQQDFTAGENQKNRDNQTYLAGLKDEKAKPATADEKTSALFAVRSKDAANLIQQLESGGYDPASLASKARSTELPFVGKPAANSKDRSYDQAKRSFITAVLRKESGAAISNPEYANEAKKYFPEPGDGPEQIAQKKAERDRAVQTLITAAGTAYDPKNQNPFQYSEPKVSDGYTAYGDDASSKSGKQEVSRKTQRNKIDKSQTRTVVTYSDGTTEVINGK
jgi:hypothetical protein